MYAYMYTWLLMFYKKIKKYKNNKFNLFFYVYYNNKIKIYLRFNSSAVFIILSRLGKFFQILFVCVIKLSACILLIILKRNLEIKHSYQHSISAMWHARRDSNFLGVKPHRRSSLKVWANELKWTEPFT